MVTREQISSAILELLMDVQGHHVDLVHFRSPLLMEDLEMIGLPANAKQECVSSVNVHSVRSLVSEALGLSNSGHWQAAENAAQRAMERWNEER